MEQQKRENTQLRAQFESLTQQLMTVRTQMTSVEQRQNMVLRTRYEELQNTLRGLTEHKSVLVRKSMKRNLVKETIVEEDPEYLTLVRQLKSLISENNRLCQMVMSKGQEVRKSMRRSMNRF